MRDKGREKQIEKDRYREGGNRGIDEGTEGEIKMHEEKITVYIENIYLFSPLRNQQQQTWLFAPGLKAVLADCLQISLLTTVAFGSNPLLKTDGMRDDLQQT